MKIFKEDNLSIYLNTRNEHPTPKHVHARTKTKDVAYSINTANPMHETGQRLCKKNHKKTQKYINENKSVLSILWDKYNGKKKG